MQRHGHVLPLAALVTSFVACSGPEPRFFVDDPDEREPITPPSAIFDGSAPTPATPAVDARPVSPPLADADTPMMKLDVAPPPSTSMPDASSPADGAVVTPPPPASEPQSSSVVVDRGGTFFDVRERFNRYYTDKAWTPARVVYVSPTGGGDGATRASPAAVSTALAAARAGTQIVFLRGRYAGCYELGSAQSGTYDAPVVLLAERNADGSRGVRVDCCATGRQACFNLEAANYVALDGFELAGGRFGVRSVGRAYTASAHQIGVAVLRTHAHDNRADPFFSAQSDFAVWEGNLGHGAGTDDGHGLYISNGSDFNIVRGNELHGNAASDFQINADPFSTCDDVGITSAGCDAVAGTGEGGAGASDFILVEGNFFHHGLAQGANFTSVRRSVVRNNIFAVYARHGVSFWQETTNTRLASSDNVIHHNLFIGTNTRPMLQLQSGASRNDVRNNIFVGAAVAGASVAALGGAVAMNVEATAAANLFAGNFYASAGLVGRAAVSGEIARSDFDPRWFARFPTVAEGARALDLQPTASSPFRDLAPLLMQTTRDFMGQPRKAPVDVGPFDHP